MGRCRTVCRGWAMRCCGRGLRSCWCIMTCLVLTWANPHVYLDTVVLIGAISAQYAPHGLAFGVGAVAASASFFTALGYGARLLAPVMARPQSWVVLEVIVGATMWAIAVALVFG